MAKLSEAVWAGEQSSLMAMSRYDIVCIHTIVGYAPAHAAHFSTRANGQIIQSRDTKYRGAANLNGNYRVISIENEDHGPAFGAWSGSNVPAFTPQQVEAIAKICAWAHLTHGIPLTLAPDSKPGSRGIAYHRQGCDGDFRNYDFGGRVAGGELWSNATGKVCPGDRRIHQLIDLIIPRARVLAGLDNEGDDEVKPKICKWQGSAAIWAVTPMGHWQLKTMGDVNDFAFMWGLPRDSAGNAIVAVVEDTRWFGPNLDVLMENANTAAAQATIAATNTTPPPA
jgi:hypothetical protein